MSARTLVINRGRRKAEELTGARMLWPAVGGKEYPVSVGVLTNAKKLNSQGGGFSLFDDAIVTIRLELFGNGLRPAEEDHVQLSIGPGETWRDMKVELLSVSPGGDALQLNLSSNVQGV